MRGFGSAHSKRRRLLSISGSTGMADVDAQPVQVEQPVQPEQPQQPQEVQDAQELQPLRVEVEDQPQGVNNEPANNNGIIYQYYTDIVNNPWVVWSYNAYTWLKQRNPNVEERLNAVEQTAYGVVSAASQKATQTYETYYVKPRDVYDVYNTNLERGKWVIQTGKIAAVHSGTIILGAAVLATQLGLQLTAGGAGIVLDTVSACQGAGVRTINNAKQMQQAVEGKIWQTIAEVQRVAKLPIDKAAETSHPILDIVRALGDTLRRLVANIAYAVVSALSAKARQQVIDPVSFQTHQILENLSRSFVTADLVRAKRVHLRVPQRRRNKLKQRRSGDHPLLGLLVVWNLRFECDTRCGRSVERRGTNQLLVHRKPGDYEGLRAFVAFFYDLTEYDLVSSSSVEFDFSSSVEEKRRTNWRRLVDPEEIPTGNVTSSSMEIDFVPRNEEDLAKASGFRRNTDA